MKEISLDFIDRQREAFYQDPQAQALTNAVVQNGPLLCALDFDVEKSLPFTFDIDLWDEGVTDQGSSGRCWAFASLNVVRHNVKRNLGLAERNFELSQNYTYFFDQLEKCSRFLNRIIEGIDQPVESPAVQNALRRPIMDNGMWNMFAELSDKYGVVPKCFMPDSHCSLETRYVTRILEQKLKLSAKELYDAHNQGQSAEQLYELKEEQLAGVFSILTRFLGVPPKTIRFEFRKKDGSYCKLPEMSPQAFYQLYGGMKSEDYMLIINRPLPNCPFMQCYTNEKEPKSSLDKKLNLPMEEIKKLVLAQLRGGDQVIMGCDVAKQSHKPSGYMHARLLQYERLFGTKLEFPDRASWLLYKGDVGATSGGHIMCFDGVALDEAGRPLRWKVHNSYGPKMGISGHYVMDDSWFDRYVSSVVIARKYAPPEILEAFDQEPQYLDHGALF